MTRVAVITQARTTSTRLPGKVLIEVAGRTLLDHHLDRLAWSDLPVLVATTANAADDPIARIAAGRGLPVHRGSEDDVLSRFHECAQAHRLDVVVRVTSDCPLIDGHVVADAVTKFLAEDDPWVYLSNGIERTHPRGLDVEVFSAQALAHAYENATEPAHREHVTPYLYASPGTRMRTRHLRRAEDASRYRLTLDTTDDLEVLRWLIEGNNAHLLGCTDLVTLLERHPRMASRNAHVPQRTLDERRAQR